MPSAFLPCKLCNLISTAILATLLAGVLTPMFAILWKYTHWDDYRKDDATLPSSPLLSMDFYHLTPRDLLIGAVPVAVLFLAVALASCVFSAFLSALVALVLWPFKACFRAAFAKRDGDRGAEAAEDAEEDNGRELAALVTGPPTSGSRVAADRAAVMHITPPLTSGISYVNDPSVFSVRMPRAKTSFDAYFQQSLRMNTRR